MPPGCRVAAVAGTADKRWIACFMGNPFVSVAFLVVGWSFSMTCRKMFGVHHSQWIWCRDSVSDERLFGCGYARIVFTQDGWSPHDSFDHWSCLLLEKSEWTSPFFMVVVINSKHPSSQEANHTMISYIFQMGYVIVFRCIQCGQLPPTEGEMLLQVLSGYPKLVNHVWITLWEFFFFFLVFLLHVYTLTSIYHLNHLSFESSSDLGAPIGLQETDHLTIRILSSFSSEAGEVKWGTPGGFFPQKPQGICDLDYGICTKAPPRRGSNLHQWRWPPCMDWIFWHFWWLSIAHVTCPGPCYRRCCVFFFCQVPDCCFGWGLWWRNWQGIPETTGETRKFGLGIVNMVLFLITFPLWKNHHGDARMGFWQLHPPGTIVKSSAAPMDSCFSNMVPNHCCSLNAVIVGWLVSWVFKRSSWANVFQGFWSQTSVSSCIVGSANTCSVYSLNYPNLGQIYDWPKPKLYHFAILTKQHLKNNREVT